MNNSNFMGTNLYPNVLTVSFWTYIFSYNLNAAYPEIKIASFFIQGFAGVIVKVGFISVSTHILNISTILHNRNSLPQISLLIKVDFF